MFTAALEKDSELYDYNYLLRNIWNLISKELSENNVKLIQKYDRIMCIITFQGNKTQTSKDDSQSLQISKKRLE